MAERIVRSNTVTRHQVRLFSPQGVNSFGWWDLLLVHAYLDSVGVPNRYRVIDDPLERGVYHVDGNHFVIAIPRGDGIVQVANPFGIVGTHTQNIHQFIGRITRPHYVGF